MKIAVRGYSGAGKSTLAKALGQRYGCGVLHLDKVQFTGGWQERNRDEARATVAEFLDRDAWIIDGNYTNFHYRRRLEEADCIVLLCFSRLTCLRQAWGRYRQFRGRVRESMADGCCEKFDLEFFLWVVWKGRTRERRARLLAVAEEFPDKTVLLKNRRQADAFLQKQQ